MKRLLIIFICIISLCVNVLGANAYSLDERLSKNFNHRSILNTITVEKKMSASYLVCPECDSGRVLITIRYITIADENNKILEKYKVTYYKCSDHCGFSETFEDQIYP